MFGEGLEMIGIVKKEEEKSVDECSHKEGSVCSDNSIDLGNGPAEFIFDPEKLREIF